jgi:hypothetical protein
MAESIQLGTAALMARGVAWLLGRARARCGGLAELAPRAADSAVNIAGAAIDEHNPGALCLSQQLGRGAIAGVA